LHVEIGVRAIEQTSAAGPATRRLGLWSAVVVVLLSVAYGVALAMGLLSLASPDEPIGDPLFSILELLIILLAPVLVVTMAAVHAWAAPDQKTFSLVALIFMSLLAGLTCSVHFAILAVGQTRLLSFTWPSIPYAIDILAWDLLFGLSVLFAAPLFGGDGLARSIRALLTTSGVLALGGLVGVPLGDMRLRMIGVVGYAVVFAVAVALLALLFYRWPVARERPGHV